MTGILDVFSKASQTPSLAMMSREPSGGSRTWVHNRCHAHLAWVLVASSSYTLPHARAEALGLRLLSDVAHSTWQM